jgi:hypothetical protein
VIARLKILGFQTGLLGQDLDGSGTEGDSVVLREQYICETGTFQNAMRGPALPFDAPPDPEQRRQSPLGLGRGPAR